jgi:hypothetical protein
MTRRYKLFLLFFSFFFFSPSAFAGISSEFGAGYGREFRCNTSIEQYELFLRETLPYTATIGDLEVSTSIEFGLALLRESDADNSGTARFSILPQLILNPRERLRFIIGLGAGLMAGETKFSENNLGGTFLFAAKLGVQLHLDEHWGIEYTYYHQSNGGIYNSNDGLNMNQFALAYIF